PDEGWFESDMRVISGDWFDALGIPVERGADPRDVDLAGEPVVWVSREAVARIFGGRDPVGQRVWAADTLRRVVGVVGDAAARASGEVYPTTYLPHAQFADDRNWSLTQAVKMRGDLAAGQERIRAALAGIDPLL